MSRRHNNDDLPGRNHGESESAYFRRIAAQNNTGYARRGGNVRRGGTVRRGRNPPPPPIEDVAENIIIEENNDNNVSNSSDFIYDESNSAYFTPEFEVYDNIMDEEVVAPLPEYPPPVKTINKKYPYRYAEHYGLTWRTHGYLNSDRSDFSYVDSGYQSNFPESGKVLNILHVPQNAYDGRIGNEIVVTEIHVCAEARLETGACASPRMVLFVDKQPKLNSNDFVIPREVDEILEKAPIQMLGDIGTGDFPDLFKNPTNMSFPAFVNTQSRKSDAITHLYDVYRDLNVTAIKGVVGEDVDTMPTKQLIKFSLRGLTIPVKFKNSNPKSIIMNNLGLLLIGDYTGGEVLTVVFTRVVYKGTTFVYSN